MSGAEQALHVIDRAVHDAREAKHGEHSKLRIGVSQYLTPSLVEIIHSIELPLYHDLVVEIATGITPDLITDVQKKNVDLALVSSPTKSTAITTLCIATDSFMIAFRKGHPLAEKETVTFSEVVEYPWVFFKRTIHPALHDLILHRAEAEQRPANIVHYGNHADQAATLVTNDSIVGWLNPAGVECAVNQGFTCVPLIDEEIRLETHIVSLADNQSPLISEFERKFVKCWEKRDQPEQLALPMG